MGRAGTSNRWGDSRCGRGDSARRYIGQQPVKVAEFEQALKMLSPYGHDGKAVAEPEAATSPPPDPEDPRLQRLESQIEALQRQLDALGREQK